MRYLFPLLLTACAGTDPAAERTAITDTLQTQAAAWNAGDIDTFMSTYTRDGSLRFASGGTITRDWQATRDRYHARYPDRAAMGTLAFTGLEIELLDEDDALVFGRWALAREADRPNGLFTLHMIKQDGAWTIASDHTSSGQ